jgi:hypothetical protein
VNYLAPNGTGRAYILEPDGSKTFLPVVAGANYTLGGNVNDSGVAVGFYGDTLDGSTVLLSLCFFARRDDFLMSDHAAFTS